MEDLTWDDDVDDLLAEQESEMTEADLEEQRLAKYKELENMWDNIHALSSGEAELHGALAAGVCPQGGEGHDRETRCVGCAPLGREGIVVASHVSSTRVTLERRSWQAPGLVRCST
eukprot:2314573-Amphidinium_carterae.1